MARTAEPRISWKVEEYAHKEKGPDWFWALGVVAIAGAAIVVIRHNYLFAVFIALSAVILGYYAARRPEIIDVAVSDDGISVRGYLYPFAALKGFAVEENPSGNRLIVESSRILMPVFSIPLPGALDADGLTALLKTRIPEKPLKEKAVHGILDRLGF